MTVSTAALQSKANPQQLEAILATDGPVLIIAGPGSGKTFTLVERIVYLITHKGVAPESLLVVTFTDKAARELTTRISNQLAELNIQFNLNEMYLGTFHSICLRMLEDYREFTRLKRSFTLFDQFDQQYFLYQHIKDFRALPDAQLVMGDDQTGRWAQSENLLKWLNNHYDVFRNPVQAKELLIEALEVQKLEFSTVFDGEKDGRMVKIMPVNRIATRADLNELIAGFDYKSWERKQNESPNRPVEKISLVCMGHEPDLAAQLELAAKPFKIDVEVVDILRDKADLEFKRDSQAKVGIKNGELIIEKFYPMNLLQKLSLQKESVEDWTELVESVLIDWNYDGAVLQPAVLDIPGKNEMVKGTYKVPSDAGTIRVKITDLLSESWEGSVSNGD